MVQLIFFGTKKVSSQSKSVIAMQHLHKISLRIQASCMSPWPLRGEMVPYFTFDRKTHMFWHNFLQILFRASFGPDASQMSPRCHPDASQMPLRCLSDASQMLQNACQMPPDASQKIVWGLALGSFRICMLHIIPLNFEFTI